MFEFKRLLNTHILLASVGCKLFTLTAIVSVLERTETCGISYIQTTECGEFTINDKVRRG